MTSDDREDDLLSAVERVQGLLATARPFAEARAALLARLNPWEPCNVLEIGIGASPAFDHLPKGRSGPGRAPSLRVGVDVDRRFLRRRRARSANPSLCCADASSLPFARNSFDRLIADKLLPHMNEPRAALAEWLRVLRPGGRVGLLDWDLRAHRVASELPDLIAFLARAQEDSTMALDALDEVEEWLLNAGASEVVVEKHAIEIRRLDTLWREVLAADLDYAVAAGIVNEATRRRWWHHLRERQEQGRFRVTGTLQLTTAVKPSS